MSKRRGLSLLNLLAALLMLGIVCIVSAGGIVPLPPVGKILNPGTGVWSIAADASVPQDKTLHLQGLEQPVRVSFESNGTAHIHAASDHDLFMTIGYLHAQNRLFQMDLMRRQGRGLLAAIGGASALSSDIFERELGLLRSAQTEWDQMRQGDPEREVILAYTQGVNAGIAADMQQNDLPLMFKLLDYRPAPWSPVDTLIIQRVLAQQLSFSTGPLEYALLVQSLGYQRTMQWFPIVPVNEQHPYDSGPYQRRISGSPPLEHRPTVPSIQVEQQAERALLASIQELPPTAVHHESNSNSWVVDGTRTVSGQALLAGDPHLNQTLPSIWYQLEGSSPDYTFAGVSVPGLPVILIGRNDNISWSITNTQNQSTLYYKEVTDAAHLHQYYWNGAWRSTTQLHESIPVKGAAAKELVVERTVHGPILTQAGQTLSVWWSGALTSPNLTAMLGILKAMNFRQFRTALRSWQSPTQTFSYADKQGNIGMLAVGYFPQVASGQPWLPLTGNGTADVSGAIPFDDLPQTYDPPSHEIFAANQRPVGVDYPYYLGTSLDAFDPGYRANTLYQQFNQTNKKLTVADMQAMQNDTHDLLAQEIVPKLNTALGAQPLAQQEQEAAALLRVWDGNMSTTSAAATLWIWFWNQYLFDTFNPWWQHFHVPTNQDTRLQISQERGGGVSDILGESLEHWTLQDPHNATFSLPDGQQRDASSVMRQAFSQTVTALSTSYGSDPTHWTWGSVHFQVFPSLTQIRILSDPPRARAGDARSLNAADGGAVAVAGPSWRFIMDWGAQKGIGVYPGGQSENPLSPWYANQIESWWNGHYYPMYLGNDLHSVSGLHVLSLSPSGT